MYIYIYRVFQKHGNTKHLESASEFRKTAKHVFDQFEEVLLVKNFSEAQLWNFYWKVWPCNTSLKKYLQGKNFVKLREMYCYKRKLLSGTLPQKYDGILKKYKKYCQLGRLICTLVAKLWAGWYGGRKGTRWPGKNLQQ